MCEWLSTREWCDVQLLCEGGVLSAHRAVLASASSFLRAVLLSCPEDDSIYIVLPEFNFEAMKSVLNYIYNGEVTINKSKIDMFLGIINAMEIYIDIEYHQILNSSKSTKTGDASDTFLNEIHNYVGINNGELTNNILLRCQGSTLLGKPKQCRNRSEKPKPFENLQSSYGYPQRNFFLRDSCIETYPQNSNVNGLRKTVPAISNEHYRALTSSLLTNTNGNDLRTEDKLLKTSKISDNATSMTSEWFYYNHNKNLDQKYRYDVVNKSNIFLNSSKADELLDQIKFDNLRNLWSKNYPLQNIFSLPDSPEIRSPLTLDSHSLDLRLSLGDSQKSVKGKHENSIKSTVKGSRIHFDRKPTVRQVKQKAIKTILNKVLENPWCPRLPRNISKESNACLNIKHKTTIQNNNKNININANLTQNVQVIDDKTKATMTETKGPSIKLSLNSCSLMAEDFKCNICNQNFIEKELLEEHMKKHSFATKYKCSECGKTFSQPRNFKYHMSVHRGTREFAATCTVCGKYFNDRGYLSSHMKIHRNRKEYKCSMCPKSFNQRVAYNMHMRIHTGVKPHVCEECGKAFSRKMLLRQHQRTHSGERPYGCPHCDKRFADRSNMTLHLRLHTGVKPFSCSLCPKSFTKKHHLKSHLNFHTGDKPYSCPRCKLGFTQSSNMRTHLKKCNAAEKHTSAEVF